MTARAEAWDMVGCGAPMRMNGGREELDDGGKELDDGGKEPDGGGKGGLEAMATGAVVAGFWKVYVGLGAVAIREAEFKSISVSSEKSKRSGELGRAGTS